MSTLIKLNISSAKISSIKICTKKSNKNIEGKSLCLTKVILDYEINFFRKRAPVLSSIFHFNNRVLELDNLKSDLLPASIESRHLFRGLFPLILFFNVGLTSLHFLMRYTYPHPTSLTGCSRNLKKKLFLFFSHYFNVNVTPHVLLRTSITTSRHSVNKLYRYICESTSAHQPGVQEYTQNIQCLSENRRPKWGWKFMGY